MKNNYLITTPIYYVNARPHLGHIYTTLLCDVMNEYQKLSGKNSFFLTGVDEHGDKIVKAADLENSTPQEYVNKISGIFEETWKSLKISNDDFIRTTQERHKKVVQHVLNKLYEKGDIYLSEYEGTYCLGCERYLTEKELNEDGNCPDHLVKPEIIKESNYFFKLQKYLPIWEKILENNPDLVKPEQYFKEISGTIQELKKLGEDLSISRPVKRLTWGIPIPFDKNYVTYVWFDALLNYISALDFPDGEKFKNYWPQARHVIAKDILKPHGIYWPTMLLAADIEIFQNLFVHGYWLGLNDVKMSKSLQNAVNPVDLINVIGLDSFRYFLMREMTFGSDSKFSESTLENRINQDLANNLGNLIQRTLSMIKKYTDGNIPEKVTNPENEVLDEIIRFSVIRFNDFMNTFQFSKALESIFVIIDKLNKLIEENKPWEMAKKNPSLVPGFLRMLLDGISIVMLNLRPFLRVKFQQYSSITGLHSEINFPLNSNEIKYNVQLPESWDILFPRIILTENEVS
ncbi:MAG: methionine--tRNA ligase [Spirochaetia bacterium]|nr:methionine--tRNA ligase [Spirochaetia bacterium]